MFRKFCPVVLLGGWLVSGCAVLDLSDLRSRGTEGFLPKTRVTGLTKDLAAIESQFLLQQMADTARGSWVNIHTDGNQSICGTLLTASTERVELLNCLCQEAVPGPEGKLQCQMSHVPFRSLATSSMTHFTVIAPPSDQFLARPTLLVADQFDVQAIRLKSGRQQRLGVFTGTLADRPSRTQPIEQLREIPMGTAISFIDVSDRQCAATVCEVRPSELEVINCVFQEVVPGIDGEPQLKTIHQPVRIYSISDLRSLEVDSAAPSGLSTSASGLDPEEFVLTDFILKNGLHIGKRGPAVASGKIGSLGRSR